MDNNCPCEARYNATKGIFYYKTGLSFYHKIVDFPHRLSVYYCLVQVTIPSGPLQVKIKQDGGFTQEKMRRL